MLLIIITGCRISKVQQFYFVVVIVIYLDVQNFGGDLHPVYGRSNNPNIVEAGIRWIPHKVVKRIGTSHLYIIIHILTINEYSEPNGIDHGIRITRVETDWENLTKGQSKWGYCGVIPTYNIYLCGFGIVPHPTIDLSNGENLTSFNTGVVSGIFSQAAAVGDLKNGSRMITVS